MKKGNEQKSQRTIAFSASTVIFASLVLVFYVISNLPSISSWLGKILAVISPVITGFAIAYIVNPILRLLERRVLRKIRSASGRRMLGIFLTYLIVAIVISAIFLLIIPQLISSFKDLINKFDSLVENAVRYVNDLYANVSKYIKFGDRDSAEANEIISLTTINEMLENFFSQTGDIVNSIFSYVQSYGSKLFSAVSDLVLALFISFYVLASKERILAQVRRLCSALFSEKRNRAIRETVLLADSTFGSFLGGKIVDCIVVGVIVYFCFLIAGVPYSAMIATIIGATNIIPFFGPIIGAVPAAFIVFISAPNKLLLFLIIDIVVLQIDGNVIEPKIIGDRTGISSLCVLISISVMGNLWGVVGMIVGVPLFAVVTALIEKFISSRLHEKGVSDDIDDYYEDEIPVKPLRFDMQIRIVSPRYYWLSLRRCLRPRKKRGQKLNRNDFRRVLAIHVPRIPPESDPASNSFANGVIPTPESDEVTPNTQVCAVPADPDTAVAAEADTPGDGTSATTEPIDKDTDDSLNGTDDWDSEDGEDSEDSDADGETEPVSDAAETDTDNAADGNVAEDAVPAECGQKSKD